MASVVEGYKREMRKWLVKSHEHKLEVLDLMLTKSNMRQALVFVTTQKAVEELIEHVTVQGHVAVPAHGGMTTAERSASVNIFRRRKAQLLVATDVAARGMDIPGLRDVIMLNLPIHAEDYVHRIGRVGRAGKPGWAWALVSDADAMRAAIRPSCVAMPVATAIPAAVPRVSAVPRCSMPVRSAGCASRSTGAGDLATGTDSPVNAASSTRKLFDSIRRISAGARSPASTTTMSPGTNRSAPISRS